MAWLSVKYAPCLFWIVKGFADWWEFASAKLLEEAPPKRTPHPPESTPPLPPHLGPFGPPPAPTHPGVPFCLPTLRWILRSAARLYFFSCFSSLLFHLSCLLSILFLLLSSSLTSALHCLLPAVTGMLKVAKMLRMQRKNALTFYSTNYPAKEMCWDQHRSVLFKMQ